MINCTQWWGSCSGTLGSVKYFFIAIISRSTLIWSSCTCWVPVYGLNICLDIWVNSRVDWALWFWYGNWSRRKILDSDLLNSALRINILSHSACVGKSKELLILDWDNIRIKNYLYSSSSCRAASMDIPDPLSPLLPTVHRFWQVLRATSRILT